MTPPSDPTPSGSTDAPPPRRQPPTPPGLPGDLSASYNPRHARAAADARDLIAPDLDGSEDPTLGPPAPGQASQASRPAQPATPTPTPAPGTMLGGFRLIGLAGRGAMGEVWEAVQAGLWRRVAVKRLRPRQVPEGTGEETVARSFQGEAMVAALLDHPNIVPVHTFGQDERGTPILAMKYVGGSAWDKLLREDFDLLAPDDHLAKHLPILVQVCQAVAFAHSRGVAHLDLKPSQVMVGDFGEVLLMDWGLAIMLGEPPVVAGEEIPRHLYPLRENAFGPAGTPGYMAPEQTESDASHVGFWTDSYLLGGILYFILAGQTPHAAPTTAEAFRNAALGIVHPLAEAAPGRPIPRELEDLAFQAMQQLPSRRPTAPEFLARVRGFLAGESNRLEAVRLVDDVAVMEPRGDADFADGQARLARAQALWPGNPRVPELRARLLDAHAQMALRRGDLALARLQAEQLPDARRRHELLSRVDSAQRAAAAQRRRLRVATGLAAALFLVIAVGSILFFQRVSEANQMAMRELAAANVARASEQRALLEATKESRRAQLLLASALVDQGRGNEAYKELLRMDEDSRSWEWSYVLARAQDTLWSSEFHYLAWSPSRELAVAEHPVEGAWLLDSFSARKRVQVAPAAGAGLVIAFSRDDALVAVAQGPSARVLRTDTGEQAGAWTLPGDAPVTALEFSPGGDQLALGGQDGSVRVARLGEEPLRDLPPHTRHLRGLFWGGDALVSISTDLIRRTAPATGESEILLQALAIESPWHYYHWQADSQRRWFAFANDFSGAVWGKVDEGPLNTVPGNARAFAFVEERQWLAICGHSSSPTYTIIDLATGEPVPDEPDPAEGNPDRSPPGFTSHQVWHIFPLEGGQRAIVTAEQDFHLVELPSMKQLRLLLPRPEGLRAVVPAPGGKAFWIVDERGGTRLFSLESAIAGDAYLTNVVAFKDQDSTLVAFGSEWYEERDARTGELRFIGGWGLNWYAAMDIIEDPESYVIAGLRYQTMMLEVTDAKTGLVTFSDSFEGSLATLGGVAVAAEPRILATLDAAGDEILARSFAGESLEEAWRLRPPEAGSIINMAFTEDGGSLLVATIPGQLLVVDAATGAVRRELRAHDGPFLVQRHSERMGGHVTLGEDGHAKVWKPGPWTADVDVQFPYLPEGVAFSESREWILGWSGRETPEVRRVDTGELVSRLDARGFPVERARFLADDSRVIGTSAGSARLWDPVSGQETFMIERGHGGLSADSRVYLHKEEAFRSIVLGLPPSQPRPGETLDQALARWRASRLVDWAGQQVRRDLPRMLEHLRWRPGELATADSLGILQSLASIRFDAREIDPGHGALFQEACSRAIITLPPPTLDHVAGPRITILVEGLRLHPGLATSTTGAAARWVGARHMASFEERPHPEDPFLYDDYLTAAEILFLADLHAGREERALATALRSAAWRAAIGYAPGAPERELLRRGIPLPPPPPADLVVGPGAAIPPLALRHFDETAAFETPEARHEAVTRAMRVHRDALLEWMDSVAPAPDYDAIIAEARADPAWVPYPEGTTVAEFAREISGHIERGLHGPAGTDAAADAASDRMRARFAHLLEAPAAP